MTTSTRSARQAEVIVVGLRAVVECLGDEATQDILTAIGANPDAVRGDIVRGRVPPSLRPTLRRHAGAGLTTQDMLWRQALARLQGIARAQEQAFAFVFATGD